MRKYDSYKDSGVEWIGEIPSHWEVMPLKRLAWIGNGQDHKKVWDENGDYPIVGTGGVFGKANEYLCKGPSVVLGRKGTIDKPQFIDNPFWSVDTAYYTEINDSINPRLFYYLCTTIKFDLYKYGSAVPSMTREVLNQIPFAVTNDLAEQTAIAAYLDRKTAEIDELIADKKRLLELYEEEKTAIINQAVTKGINPDVPMKDSGIEWLGEIPEHWEVKRFDYLFDFSRGLPITKADLRDSGIPCVSYGEIHSKYGFEVDPNRHLLKCVDEKYLETNNKSLLQSGDFVFADTSEDLEGSGNFTYLNSSVPTFAGYHTIIGKPIIEFERRYVAYYFNTLSFRNQIRSKVTGTKVFSVTQAILKFTNIIFPPIYEQQAIVDFIDKEFVLIDSKKAKTEKLIELLTEYRTALISEVVTGKIKVTP